jgi:hypothetical protein
MYNFNAQLKASAGTSTGSAVTKTNRNICAKFKTW